MTTNITPHVHLSPDQPIEITIGFTATDAAVDDWSRPAELALDLFARFVIAGAFVEPCPHLRWQATISRSNVHVVYQQLPHDPSVLGVLARVLLALPRPPAVIQVRGTPAPSGSQALPSTAAALELVPRVRPRLAFALEMEPGSSWLAIEVSCNASLDVHAAQLVDERIELWCEVCRAGGLSEVSAEQLIEPGDVGKYEPSVGEDFYSVEIMYQSVSFAAPGVLPNLLDELARNGLPIDGVSVR